MASWEPRAWGSGRGRESLHREGGLEVSKSSGAHWLVQTAMGGSARTSPPPATPWGDDGGGALRDVTCAEGFWKE